MHKRTFTYLPFLRWPLFAFLLTVLPAHAVWADTMDTIGTWAWSGTSSSDVGYTFAGSATFYNLCIGGACPTSGTWELEIVVQNLAPASADQNPDMLGGVMFNISYASGAPGALSMISAVATTGMFTVAGNTKAANSANTNICAPGFGENGTSPAAGCTASGGWDAVYNATGVSPVDAPGSMWGIGSAGFSSAGPGGTGVFNGGGVGNLDYQIAPTAGVGVHNNYPFVDGTATFIFTGLTQKIVNVSNVYGWYGTAPDASFGGQLTTPEPASLAEFAIGGAILAFVTGRRKLAKS